MTIPRKILVVDDETLARERLIRLILQRKEGHEVAAAENGLTALDMMESFCPHIVFLDIIMPGLTGFEVLYQLPKRNFQIIFQTAHHDFALQAFEENACDYLLKPVDQERFNRAMERVLLRTQAEANLIGLEDQLIENHQYLETLAIREGNYTHLVRLTHVDSLVSSHHYTVLRTRNNKEYLTRLSLAQFAQRLSPNEFFQIHRNALVKLAAIDQIRSGDPLEVLLLNGQRLTVSRGRRKLLMALLNGLSS